MADLTQYLAQKYTKMVTEITTDLSNTADDLENMKVLIRALKKPDIFIAGGSLTLDRIQIMETGDIRVLPLNPMEETNACFS
jgi:hypothetical protein